MILKKGQLPILIINACGLLLFTVLFASRKNYEFLLYIGVIVFFLALILATNKRVDYPNSVLWGLTVWAFLHMSGGGLYVGEVKLYEIILVPISDTYHIFRYDQFVHIVGFGVATFVMYVLLKPLLIPDLKRWTALSIVVVMAGLGVGALNEIVEFTATVLVPETGVGGYINTSLDLVSDLVGAIIAIGIIRIKKA
jgi:putative membrane protein